MTSSRSIPDCLAHEYRLVERLGDPESRNAVLRVESTRTRHQCILKLPARSCLADDAFLEALSRRAAGPDSRLATPFRVGRDADGRFFTMAGYHPEGSLRDRLSSTGRLPEAAIRPLLRDLAAALAQLHRELDGRRIVHCDVKPSNVLIVRRGSGEADWEFRLSDFDSSVLTPLDEPASTARTVEYAAPETYIPHAGSPAPAMDYWSLGMLMLACIRGRHPFDGLHDDRVRELVVTDWHVDVQYLRDIGDEALRALIAGLLQRRPGDRWGEEEIRRWLDGDAEAVVSGLRLLGERAAPTPFTIGGEACYTAGNAARALLRSWDTGALYGDAFPSWLRTLSPTAASCADDARREPSRDAGLLRFCRTLYPEEPIPAIWRGERISASNLAALAGRATRGDSAARAWLLGFLIEDEGFRHFPAHDCADVAALAQSIVHARAEYTRAWRDIVDAGAPRRSAPSEDDAWLDAVLIACSPAATRPMPEEMLDPQLIMRRADWFFVFGTDPDRLDPSRRFVLRQLQGASLVVDANVAHIDERGDVDPRALREGTALSELQRRTLSSLSVRPGARIARLVGGDTFSPERPPPGSLIAVEGAPGVFRRRVRRRASPPAQERSRAGEQQDGTPVAAGQRTGGEPMLAMRIVRLDVASRRLAAMDGELYLAQIEWSGGSADTRLAVYGIDTLLPVRRLRIAVPDAGRMLLVIDRSTRVELRGAGDSRAQRRRRSMRILMGRGSRAPLRRVAGDVLPLLRRGPIDALGPILRAGAPLASARRRTMLPAARPARHRPALRAAASPGLLGGLAVAPPHEIARVAVGARQRRHAASFSARSAGLQQGNRSP